MFMLSPPRVKLPALTWMMLVPADFSERLDRAARAGAERHHRNHGGHADDHAEHGERRAKAIAAERPQRDLRADDEAEQHMDDANA